MKLDTPFDGAFQGQPGTDESNATTALELIAVAFLQAKVERTPARHPRGMLPLYTSTEEMASALKTLKTQTNDSRCKWRRCQEQWFGPALRQNVKAAVPLTGALDAGQHLDGFQDVHFAHQRRQALMVAMATSALPREVLSVFCPGAHTSAASTSTD